MERLLFAQGGVCFFCKDDIPGAERSVEHLIASTLGGSDKDENCVVCCKSRNGLFGRMSLKEKIQVVLNQKNGFACPNKKLPGMEKSGLIEKSLSSENFAVVLADLERRGVSKPRTLKTLTSTVNALLRGKADEKGVEQVLRMLKQQKKLTVEGTKVSYSL